MPGTDIEKAIDFPLVKKEDAAEALEGLEHEQLDAFDLPLIHAGAGGSLEWVPERGARAVPPVVAGVILHAQIMRVYYPGEYKGGGEPPACSSDDGKNGIGDPGGVCAQCPFDQWGSGEGNSKACSEKRMVYLLEPNTIIPMVVQVSAGSLGNWKAYLTSMANDGGYKRWTSELSIETASGAYGPYPRVAFRPGSRLTDKARDDVKAYGEKMAPLLSRAQKPVYQSEGE